MLKKKENLSRFKEKFCFFTKKKTKGKLIWFHGASVGEIQSIIPILEKLEKENKIKTVLITSNTLSSSKIVAKFKFKKIIHQFFPIDTNYFSSKFIKYWKPSAAYFIDSEIWPNTIINLKKRKIPIMLINGRITSKTFKKWKMLPNFSKYIFRQIDKCLPASKKSENFLQKLGVLNIKFIGNLKFSQSENEKSKVNKKLNKFINSRKTWCASSTHYSEEKFCGLIHKKLKKKYKNLLTIIIPRHIHRIKLIEDELNELGLKTQTHLPFKKINKNIDIYLVNSYGQTKSFFNTCKTVFLGGSIINHGGQNPLEATRYGCNILHGPNVDNFKEIYEFLRKNKISSEVKNPKIALKKLDELLIKQSNSKNIQVKLKKIGKKILQKTYKEIIF
ncbi:3-deoxy-D-manno-octulosonic acid transferase [Candidatus Pelagibacter sp.]|nr:3-deoxy-D-manno-octulosonic acid transferase [Candidatus Pelagibacter sp.]